ncbi:oxidoreductase [Fictibacillus arsenicus]|jgi:flavin reductase (DIM6/NTAB) family NADH-FMN oxidoreductase RutF|uniref:Oxidoreductase n=1 Tax=Fictibacillus arsenicus TaxID=255247 RepID=A0A1B1Z0B7_9BACL|nr:MULTISPECIES: flavin reductase family protein [Fictibacillus]ANX10931.1 oxidoreductase [Fictibacillus arsenicus]MCM3733826.1 flavin reductase family protein [Fictibacillus nanhaiensis]
MDGREFRNCMGHFATGVTVVTCNTDGGPHGFTVNSFTSVSLDPPLILVSVDRKTKAIEFMKNNNFTVNILKEEQQDTAMHFAGRPLEEAPFQWEKGKLSPRLQDSLAYIECEPFAEYDGGDHVLFIGKVSEFEYRKGSPLTYYCGKFSSVSTQLSL